MTQILAIAIKELKLLIRDPGGLLMLFVLPAIFILVLSIALQGAFSSLSSSERLDVLVVNQDEDGIGEKIIEALDRTGYFRLLTEVDGKALTRESAKEKLSHGHYQIAVFIPAEATEALAFKKEAYIEILVDPVLSAEFATAVQKTVQSIVYVSMIGLTRSGGMPISVKEASEEYVTTHGLIVEQRYTSAQGKEITPNSVQQNVPGWTVFALFWIAQILAINLITERLTGAYARILVAPMSLLQYLLGKILPFFLINLLQAALMFAIGIYVLPWLGAPRLEIQNPGGVMLLTVAISFVSISFGLFLAAISRSSFMVASISAAALIIMTVIGGIMVPKFVMPAFMQQMSLVVPHGWALDGYLNLLVRHYATEDILPIVGVLCLYALGFFLVALLRFMTMKPVR